MGVEVVSSPANRADPLAQSLGYLNWAANPLFAPNSAVLVAGTIYAEAIWLPAGTVTNIVLSISTVAAGTAPTSFFVGIGNGATVSAISADRKADAALTTLGQQVFPLTAPLAVSDGLYHVLVLQVGSWGTTQPAFHRTVTGNTGSGIGGAKQWGTTGTSQTVLPSVTTAYTVTAGTLGLWAGVS